jgi:hypothetical protein
VRQLAAFPQAGIYMPANNPGNNSDEQTITLESDDGHAYQCRILGVFEFDNKEYALLLNVGDGDKETGSQADADESSLDEASTVIMQLIEKDDQAIFRTIESDEEFERVVAYVKELALESDEDEGAQPERKNQGH